MIRLRKLPYQLFDLKVKAFVSCCMVAVYASFSPTKATSQDIEQVYDDIERRFQDPLKLSGYLGIQLQGYQTSLEVNRAAPFNGSLNGNLNVSILGVTTPLSLIYSSGGAAYNIELPSFGFVGISPSYRDYTLHLGDRALTLGKYSFNNHSFRGVGAEVNKEKWYTKMFLGRLQRAQASDFNGYQNIDPLFRRMGWGGLAGVRPTSDSKMEVSLFRAWDDPSSLPPVLDSLVTASPAENMILSTFIEQNIFQKFKIGLNYSSSAFTASSILDEPTSANSFRSYFGLLKTNTSTRWKNALELKVSYLSSLGLVNVSYERIDPGYRTLGALFFQDDQENITLGLSSHIFNKKVTIMANGGLQNNNLGSDRAEEYQRLIGSIQSNIRPATWLNLNVGYSNFSSVNRQIRILDPEAPTQLTELALTNGSFNFSALFMISKNDQLSTSLTRTLNQTITRDEQVAEQKNNISNINLFYRKSWPNAELVSSLQVFHNSFSMPFLSQAQSGIMSSISKPFLQKRLNATLSLGYSDNTQENLLNATSKSGHLWQLRTMLSWQVNQSQSLRLDGSLLSNRGTEINNFSESRIAIAYAANFK